MTAQPVARALPYLDEEAADRHDLVDVRTLARTLKVSVETMKYVLSRPAAPAPVALAKQPFYGRHAPLYVRAHLLRWVDSETGPEALGGRRRSAPVRVVGLRTTTAGRNYRWRDPARPNPRQG